MPIRICPQLLAYQWNRGFWRLSRLFQRRHRARAAVGNETTGYDKAAPPSTRERQFPARLDGFESLQEIGQRDGQALDMVLLQKLGLVLCRFIRQYRSEERRVGKERRC